MKQTRIGIIRKIIKDAGGREIGASGDDYYADGPRYGSAHRRPNSKILDRDETIYKVRKSRDGLTFDQRVTALKALRAHPDVKDAYFSRQYTINCGPYKGVSNSGHLKIVFQGTVY